MAYKDINQKDIRLFRTQTKSYIIRFRKNNAPIDITDWTVYFTVKKNMKDSDTDAKITKKVTDHSNPSGGKAVIELSSSDLDIEEGNYYYSIDYKDDDDNTQPLFFGRLKIEEPVRDERD